MKTLFTLTKHQLTHQLGGDELSSWDKIHELRANLFDQQQVAIDILVKLSNQYELQDDQQIEGLVSEEIETINKEFKDVMEQANGYISESKRVQREYLEYYILSIKQEKPADLQGISSSRTFKKNHNGSKAEANKINKCTKRTIRQPSHKSKPILTDV